MTHHSKSSVLGGLTWSPDGSRIASFDGDEAVQVWDAVTGKNIFTYDNHCGRVTTLAWSPDGTHIASAGYEEGVRVWQAIKQHDVSLPYYQQGKNGIMSSFLIFSISLVIVAAVLAVLRYTRKRQARVWEIIGPAVIVFILTIGILDQAILIPQATHIVKKVTAPMGTTVHSNIGEAVAWSPDARYIALETFDGVVQVKNATTWGTVLTYRSPSYTPGVLAWSPDGKHIASISKYSIVRVWDAMTGRTLLTYRGHTDTVNTLAWSPDGKRIASGSNDETLQVWDAMTGRTLLTYRGHSGDVSALAWSPDGKHIVFIEGGVVQIRDATTGNRILTYTNGSSDYLFGVRAIAWSPDGTRIASTWGDGTVQVWDALTGGRFFTRHGHSQLNESAVAWSPDSRYIALGDDLGLVQIWDAMTGSKVFNYSGHCIEISAIVWSPDGTRIASTDGLTVQVWLARSGPISA